MASSVVLASTWNPRGELPRLQRLLPQLRSSYAALIIMCPPATQPEIIKTLDELVTHHSGVVYPGSVLISSEWGWGRHLALKNALGCACLLDASHIHYADMDRLLRWVEVYPQEWQDARDVIPQHDCLIFGRSPKAYATHPHSLIQTEAISNRVVSYLLGKPVDVSAGSKSFSRRAVECIIANCEPGHAIGTDGEWPVILHRAGFSVDTIELDGLDWETADRYREQAANPDIQRRIAEVVDADPINWLRRVEIAGEIVEAALFAYERSLH